MECIQAVIMTQKQGLHTIGTDGEVKTVVRLFQKTLQETVQTGMGMLDVIRRCMWIELGCFITQAMFNKVQQVMHQKRTQIENLGAILEKQL